MLQCIDRISQDVNLYLAGRTEIGSPAAQPRTLNADLAAAAWETFAVIDFQFMLILAFFAEQVSPRIINGLGGTYAEDHVDIATVVGGGDDVVDKHWSSCSN